MTTKLRIRGSDGKAAIYSGADDVFDNPHLAPHRVAFHSDLRYMTVAYDQSATFTLAQPQYKKQNGFDVIENTHYLPDHNLGVIPFAVFILDGKMIVGADYRSDVYFNGQASGYYLRRQLNPGYDASRVWLRDFLEYQNLQGGGSPGRTVTVRALLFAPSLEETLPNTAALISTARIAMGNGKFDTDKKYLRNVGTPNPLFRYLGYQTIDGSNGNVRVLEPNGGVKHIGEGAYDDTTSESLAPTIGQGFDA